MRRREFIKLGALAALGLASGCRRPGDGEIFAPGRVTTLDSTLDLDLQDAVERHILAPLRARVARGSLPKKTEAAFVLLDAASGDVLAYAGTLTRGASASEFDCASGGSNDCGSTIKPIVLAAGLEGGYVKPEATYQDEPLELPCPSCPGGVYRPKNFGNRYQSRALSPAEIIIHSSNVGIERLFLDIPFDHFQRTLKLLGLPEAPNRLTAPLGIPVSLVSLVSAYTAFARPDGAAVAPRHARAVTVGGGPRVEIPVQPTPRVFRPEVTAYVRAAMRRVLTEGTGRSAADLDCLALKTGSSTSCWIAAVSGACALGAWVGRGDSAADIRYSASALALPLVANFVREARRLRPAYFPTWRT